MARRSPSRAAWGSRPEWGEDNGSCNDSCKRWVSACLLARTNAYGAHVEISIRAPRSRFQALGDIDALERTKYLQTVEDADPTKDENTLFPLREGAYFGNIFNSLVAPDGTLVHDPEVLRVRRAGQQRPADHQPVLLEPGRRVRHLHRRSQFHRSQPEPPALHVGYVHQHQTGVRRDR